LAHHYSRSDNLEKAIEYLERAGNQALQRSAYRDAINRLTAAIDLLQRLTDSPENNQRELLLQLAVGSALFAVKGFASPQAERAHTRASELCQRLGDPPELFPTLYGLRLMHSLRGELRTAHGLSQHLLRLALSTQDPSLLLCAHHSLGITLYGMGEFLRAKDHLEMAISLYHPERPLAFLYGELDAGVACLSIDVWNLWQLGYPDQALKRANEALALAQGLSHPLSLALARQSVTSLRECRREALAAQETAESGIALSTEYGFTQFLAVATFMHGWAVAEQGRRDEGIAQMREGLAATRATGTELYRPYHLCLLAKLCKEAGHLDDGLNALTEALAAADEHENRSYEAETYRLRGELLLKQGKSNEAEARKCFERAVEIARKQSAKSLELRATTSLVRLLDRHGKRDGARTMLAEIYGWFTEGFDTADLKDAKALLDELPD
jgi:predicted ATPase